ncbi:MAG: hypothetical protein KA116_01630 [Proteobacteria bacterium]|nr:hypothetical protein [Pseudomonadota bacterium]
MSRKPSRTPEVLDLISRYGVLSTRVLLMLTNHEIGSRWMRQILNELDHRQLICRASSSLDGRPVDFWMLTKNGFSQSRVCNITGNLHEELRFKSAKYTHFPHENLCTIFQCSLERELPSIKIFREATGSFKEIPQSVLSHRLRSIGYAPDIVLKLPNTSKWVAVEIDRSYRTLKRLSQRVNMYTRHSGFDALLYLMPKSKMTDSLISVFNSRGANEAMRIRGSKNTFLATALTPKCIFNIDEYKVQVSKKTIPLTTWLSIIALTNQDKRDACFEQISSHMEEINFGLRNVVS